MRHRPFRILVIEDSLPDLDLIKDAPRLSFVCATADGCASWGYVYAVIRASRCAAEVCVRMRWGLARLKASTTRPNRVPAIGYLIGSEFGLSSMGSTGRLSARIKAAVYYSILA
jgi:hypothetical protein